MAHLEALRATFYDRDSRRVAVDLLGCALVHETADGVVSGVIVETEAYRPEDPACHAYQGPTMRNRTIFGRPGLYSTSSAKGRASAAPFLSGR